MNNGERDALVMRHLERAYLASCGHDNKGRGDNEVEGAILEAIAILNRRGTRNGLDYPHAIPNPARRATPTTARHKRPRQGHSAGSPAAKLGQE